MKEAMLYEKLSDGRVRCNLCSRRCIIPTGELGFCRVRRNVKGTLYSLVYGKVCSLAVDPILKKPLYHFHPGSSVLSLATVGCNFRCRFCLDGNDMIPLVIDGKLHLLHARELDKLLKDRDVVDLSGRSIFVVSLNGETKVLSVSRRTASDEIYEITTTYGRRIKLTREHILPVLDGDGRVSWKRADQVRRGDQLIVFARRLKNVEVSELNLIDELVSKTPVELLENVYVTGVKRFLTKVTKGEDLLHTKPSEECDVRGQVSSLLSDSIPISLFNRTAQAVDVNLEEIRDTRITLRGSSYSIPAIFKLTPEFTRLIGYFLAGGYYDDDFKLIVSGSEDIIRDVEYCVASSFLEATVASKVNGKTSKLLFGGKLVYLLFRYVLEIASKPEDRKIPDLMFNVNKGLLREFLSAYLTYTGALCKEKDRMVVRFRIKSESVKSQLSYILASNGVDFAVQPCSGGGWKLDVYDYRSLVNLREIAVFLDDRQRELEEYLREGKVSCMERKRRTIEQVKEIRIVKPTHTYVYDISLDAEDWDKRVFFAGDGILVHNCDNWVISQEKDIRGEDRSPEDLVSLALDYGCDGISYTYTEPTIFFELTYDTAKLAKERGLFNTYVTNGYMTVEAVETIAPYLDAATVDFKGGGNPEFYRKFMLVPSVDPIYDAIETMKKHGIHVEITNLVVTRYGDSIDDVKKLARWIYESLGGDTVFHLLRFHPDFQLLDVPSTPIKRLEEAYRVAKEEGLKYVYLGNVPGHPYEDTYCPRCGSKVVDRFSFEVVSWKLKPGNICPYCGYKLAIVGEYHPGRPGYPLGIY